MSSPREQLMPLCTAAAEQCWGPAQSRGTQQPANHFAEACLSFEKHSRTCSCSARNIVPWANTVGKGGTTSSCSAGRSHCKRKELRFLSHSLSLLGTPRESAKAFPQALHTLHWSLASLASQQGLLGVVAHETPLDHFSQDWCCSVLLFLSLLLNCSIRMVCQTKLVSDVPVWVQEPN